VSCEVLRFCRARHNEIAGITMGVSLRLAHGVKSRSKTKFMLDVLFPKRCRMDLVVCGSSAVVLIANMSAWWDHGS
jgi:hypothetical protein